MAKKKGKGGSSKDGNSSQPNCSCTDPYSCKCGNRPPRPSKGHKWDPEAQAWGGKGHKQKGASGQTASVGAQAQTTAVGKTQIEQWQRMPSQILDEQCQKSKRTRPKYKNIEKKDGMYKYRTILPDGKDSDKDMIIIPKNSVGNEEQAKEESALLALHEIAASLPHERRLPEPYRTTWLNLIQKPQKLETGKKDVAKPTNQQQSGSNSKPPRAAEASPTTTSSSAPANQQQQVAKASDSLKMAKSYTSAAERRKVQEETRRKRNEKIRRHEAVRMANRNHPVVMSAKIRMQIEALLRGDANFALDDDQDEEEDPVNGDDNDGDNNLEESQVYVERELVRDGFTRRQARTSYTECRKNSGGSNATPIPEEQWDGLYESCLQWLLVHLDENQLPEGYEKVQGRLFDVISPTSNEDGVFAPKYGLADNEVSFVRKQSIKDKIGMEDALWKAFVLQAGSSPRDNPAGSDNNPDAQANQEILQQEVEALEAYFPSGFTKENKGDVTTLTLEISGSDLSLEVAVKDGAYPSEPPIRTLVKGQWPADCRRIGTRLHVELIRFVNSLERGDPMIFEIHSHLESLLQSPNELPRVSLAPADSDDKLLPNKPATDTSQQQGKREGRKNARHPTKRPRDRSYFWSCSPTDAPPATSFPDISMGLKKTRSSLPAAGARSEFLNTLKNAQAGGRVLLVTGDTGCGKTTQIPQFILEEFPTTAKIVVAQPRRLAATGVAARVAAERGESEPGVGSIGYVVRGDTAMDRKCRLLFCTTGVLLRQMQQAGALDAITHVVVDEVHERHLDTDVLLGLLRRGLNSKPPLKINVILMSATLDAERFAAYWGNTTPTIHIPGRTFPVQDFFLEDVLALTKYIPSKKKGKKGFASSSHFERGNSFEEPSTEDTVDEQVNAEPDPSVGGTPISELVKRVDETRVDYTLVAHLVKQLVLQKSRGDDGSILVFLSGAPEISMAMETIKRCTSNLPVFILPLHGGLQPKEQNQVFRSPPSGVTKVILSTNICETSVTIPDCTIVIDSGRVKESSYDPVNRMPLLVEQFASKASLKQRRGRAGRVREGVCYKLISRSTWGKLDEHSKPEISRCALDQTLLSLIFLGVENGSGTFMRTLLDPPSKESLRAAAGNLQKLGAVQSFNDEFELTPLGMHLAGIPAPPMVSKMLIAGAILSCRSAALSMAAGITIARSPFLRVDNAHNQRSLDPDSPEVVKAQKVLGNRSDLHKRAGNSDLAMLAAVFAAWQAAGFGQRKQLCDSLGLSFTAMRDINQLRSQLDSSLTSIGYSQSKVSDINSDSYSIVRACVVAAMAPSQIVKVVRPAATFQQTAEGAMEVDGDAKRLKFFVRSGDEVTASQQAKLKGRHPEERVFMHPMSFNFSCGSYHCPWLVYHSLVRTSKPFLRDTTECSSYSLLLFGGNLAVKASSSEGSVVIDDWVTLSSSSRIVSLVGGLRRKVDEMLLEKIDNPSFQITSSKEMQLIVKLLKTNGEGT